MKTFQDIKESTEQAVENREELHDEAEWMAHDKLTEEEVRAIAESHGLYDNSPTSYDSAHNRSIDEILASFIADKLKREIEV